MFKTIYECDHCNEKFDISDLKKLTIMWRNKDDISESSTFLLCKECYEKLKKFLNTDLMED